MNFLYSFVLELFSTYCSFPKICLYLFIHDNYFLFFLYYSLFFKVVSFFSILFLSTYLSSSPFLSFFLLTHLSLFSFFLALSLFFILYFCFSTSYTFLLHLKKNNNIITFASLFPTCLILLFSLLFPILTASPKCCHLPQVDEQDDSHSSLSVAHSPISNLFHIHPPVTLNCPLSNSYLFSFLFYCFWSLFFFFFCKFLLISVILFLNNLFSFFQFLCSFFLKLFLFLPSHHHYRIFFLNSFSLSFFSYFSFSFFTLSPRFSFCYYFKHIFFILCFFNFF